MSSVSSSSPSSNDASDDTQAIAARVQQYFACWSPDLRKPGETRNPLELAAEVYAPEEKAVYYDLYPPTKHMGWTGFCNGLRNNPHFAKVSAWKLSPREDLGIEVRGNVAWTTQTFGISAKFKDGSSLETEGRATMIWEKKEGTWWLVHDHASVPMGAADIKPPQS